MHPAQQGYRTADSNARAGSLRNNIARTDVKSPNVIMRSVHLVFVVALIAAGSVPVAGAAPGSVSGMVRDSSGLPQIGAEVQLLRPDLTVIASVYTNTNGRFIIPSIRPGRYALKAMGTSFLPSLREDVRVRTGTVVNLTLNTLYEVMQWLPSEPRGANADQDDWKWTLRSAANRPLLRWLEDGPLVVASDGSGAAPRLKARLVAMGQQGTFGESGERVEATAEDSPSDKRELLAEVDFAPETDAGMESRLGFRQDLGFAGAVQSVAAVSIHPEIESAGSEGLEEAAMRSEETINLGDEFSVEAGSSQVLARFQQDSPNTVAAVLPFANVAWRSGNSTVAYGMLTSLPSGVEQGSEAGAAEGMPAVSMRDGRLVLEHGLHQQIGWERQTDSSNLSVMVYADRVLNPVTEAAYRRSAQDSDVDSATSQLLFDAGSGLARTAGPGFSSAGVVATAQHRLLGKSQIRVRYASGNALMMGTAPSTQPQQLGSLLASARTRHAQTYSISLSGTLDGSGTRWRAIYRWQPESTLTAVAPFSESGTEPYLNLQLRQPFRLHRDSGTGFEALLNLRNLLAQGYQPYVLSDGSVLVFAQAQRGVSGGLAFTF